MKQEAQLNNKQRHTQRTNRLEEKRELVESTKQEFSQPEESKNFSFHQKEKVRSCAAPRHARSPPLPHGCTCCTPPAATPSPTASSLALCSPRMPQPHSPIPPSLAFLTTLPPRSVSFPCLPTKLAGRRGAAHRAQVEIALKQEREAFLSHAHENHEKNDTCKGHMREMRTQIIKRNTELAAEERAQAGGRDEDHREGGEEAATARCAMRCTRRATPSRRRSR